LIGENIVLVPESTDSSVANFYTLVGTAKGVVEFRFDRPGLEMIYQSYKYRKTSPLRSK
jgi:hypothetical protein